MALRRFTVDSPDRSAPAADLGVQGLDDLYASDPQVRRQAVWLAEPNARLMEAICDRLTQETDQPVLEAMFVALSRCATPRVIASMFALLGSEEVLLRTRALEVLEGFPQEVAAQMADQLRQAEPDVRIFLVNLMGGLRHAQVPQWLESVLLHDEHSNVVAAALEVAAEVADSRMRSAVLSAKQRFASDPFLGFAADLALQRIEAQ